MAGRLGHFPLADADGLLRIGAGGAARLTLARMLLLLVIFGLFYGAVMGTFGGLGGDRALQVVYSGVKVPLLLMVTMVVSLPSFFVINSLLGLRDDFAEAMGALVATQAALTVVLASLAPITGLWYASSANYRGAILFNAVMFGCSTLAAQIVLRRLYAPLIGRNPLHGRMVKLWFVLYAFVGIQMGWVLRPFVGDPLGQVEFFRHDAWGNAYEFVAKMVWDVVNGRGR